MTGTLTRAMAVSLAIVAPATAVTLDELDAQLRAIEGQVEVAGVSPARMQPEILPPKIEIIAPERQTCAAGSEDMLAERALLEGFLQAKQEEVSGLGRRVSEMRRTLLKKGCSDSDRRRLADLKADIAGVMIDEEQRRADALLDCANQKIVSSEREKTSAIEDGAGSYEILGLNKRLDALNDFSSKMIDLSIEMTSAADLRDRLERSVEQFDALCIGDTF